MTESPLMKSLGMKRSLLTGVEPFLPLPVLGICTNTLRIRQGVLLLVHLSQFSSQLTTPCMTSKDAEHAHLH